MEFQVIGLLVNSALYLAAVFVAGLITHHRLAWELAILSAGLNYFCYFAQIGTRWLQPMDASTAQLPLQLSAGLIAVTVIVGLAAGIALLF